MKRCNSQDCNLISLTRKFHYLMSKDGEIIGSRNLRKSEKRDRYIEIYIGYIEIYIYIYRGRKMVHIKTDHVKSP